MIAKKFCVITGSRAEYGLLQPLMQAIRDTEEWVLQVAVTGMHLLPEYGLTYREIEKDGFDIDYKVESLTAEDSALHISKSIGRGTIGFADAFNELQPDLIVVLGDRFEILAAVTSALIARIPVAHLHGGEVTEGAFDEGIRHSITKMSHIHFVAAEEYRQRVIQLGEHPNRVFRVGALGIDNILNLPLLSREELEAGMNFRFGKKNLLVTFHPVTLDDVSSTDQMKSLLEVLDDLDDTHLIFTMPNADTEGLRLMAMIDEFSNRQKNTITFKSMGQLRYLSALQYVDGVVGNSSSGLIEAPSFRIGTVNIGNRQTGRLKADSVIDCCPDKGSIKNAIKRLYSQDFRLTLNKTVNPYGEDGACKAIIKILKTISLEGLVRKSFYDLENS